MNRRAYLATIAGSVAALAGCTNSGASVSPTPTNPDESPTDSPEPSETPTPEPTGDLTPTPTPIENGTPTPAPGAELKNNSFENGLQGWTVGRDLPADPGNPDRKVGSEADVTAHESSQGYQSIEFFLDGSADDGTIWVQQPIDLTGVETLAVDGYVEKESFNTIAQVAVYTGPDPDRDLVEADFNRDNATEDHDGWKTYEYDVTHDGPGLVAVGINIVWETGVRRQLDNVRLLAE